MRIIGGTLKGRRFNPPELEHTRPTTDFAKTGLYNILVNNFDFDGISFLDLFSGTGAHSLEFASRGAQRIVSVDMDYKCVSFLNKMKAEWNLSQLEVWKTDVFKFINNCNETFDVIFAGPPYALERIDKLPDLVFEKKLLKQDGWFILETDPHHSFDNHPHFLRKRNYGSTIFHIFAEKQTDKTTTGE